MLNINTLQPMGREMLNRSQFGGNTGQQGVFDMEDPDQLNTAVQRLAELTQTYGPRLAHNYTGDTGLQKHDARGYSAMLNARTEADNIQRTLDSRSPLDVRAGGATSNTSAPMQGLMGAANYPQQMNPAWTQQRSPIPAWAQRQQVRT